MVLTDQARLYLLWFGRVIYNKWLENDLLERVYFVNIICGD